MLCRSLLQHLQLLLALGVCRQFCLASHISGPRVAAESCLQFPLWSCFSEPRYKRCHRALQLSSPVFRALSCCVPKFLLTRWFIVVSQPNYASFACALPSSPLGISSTSLICFMYRLITEEQTSCAHDLCNIVGSTVPYRRLNWIHFWPLKRKECIKTQKSSCTTVKPCDSKLNVCTLSSELKST